SRVSKHKFPSSRDASLLPSKPSLHPLLARICLPVSPRSSLSAAQSSWWVFLELLWGIGGGFPSCGLAGVGSGGREDFWEGPRRLEAEEIASISNGTVQLAGRFISRAEGFTQIRSRRFLLLLSTSWHP
uniref:Uncharacterized protein n=1 Tax=Oryza meridionalis TaxID=40149 RepID=A0A0E0C9D0_9ORYZ